MVILKVPYAEKDEAKALGARWNNARKVWYVPDGQASAPFERWIAQGQAVEGAGAPGRVDAAAAGVPVVGAHFLVLDHDCDPFTVCPTCAPVLAAAGWTAARDAALASASAR